MGQVQVPAGVRLAVGYRKPGVGKMRFDVDKVRKCLIEKGKVFSVRSYEAEDGEVEVSGVGICSREMIGEVRGKEDLVKYVESSGFESVDEWWKVIEGFIKGGKKKWLYSVEVIENRQRRRNSAPFVPNTREGLLAKDQRYQDLAKEPWAYDLTCRCGRVARLLEAGRREDKPEVWSIILACQHCRVRFHIFRRSEQDKKEVSHAAC